MVLSDQVLSDGAFPKEAEGRAAGLGFVVEDGNLRGFAACGRHKRAIGTLILQQLEEGSVGSETGWKRAED